MLVELNGKAYVPQYDLIGNLSLLISESEKTEVYRYSAYGEELFAERRSPWRFSSKRVDPETGWVYFGRRYYDSLWGRWTTADPAWFADGPNLYAYVHNNPLKYCDPDGRFSSRTYQRFQGGCQMVGGLFEMAAGAGITFSSGFLAAPVGGLVLAHGADQYSAGSRRLITGEYSETLTSQLLQKTGISRQTANFVDDSLSMVNTMGGAAAIQRARYAFSVSRLPKAAGGFAEPASISKMPLSKMGSGGTLGRTSKALKGLPEGFIWKSASPFKNKTAVDLDKMFIDKGFIPKGRNPILGQGSYINPKNGRKYYIDPYNAGRYRKANHVDVSRIKDHKGSLQKKRFGYLDD